MLTFTHISRCIRNASIALIMGAASASAFADIAASVTLVSGDATDIYPGDSTRLQITLSNNNTASATNAVAFASTLPGTLPNGLKIASGPVTYTCVDPSGPTTTTGAGTLTASANGQTISLSGGVVPRRANSTDGTCTIVVPVTAGTSTGNAATYAYQIDNGAVTGNDGSAVANNGAVQQSINVRALTRPAISKAFGTGTLAIGGASTTLTLSLSNSNPVPITNFTINDLLPQLAGSSIIDIANPPGIVSSCNNGGSNPSVTAAAGGDTVQAIGTIPARTAGVDGLCTVRVNVVGVQNNNQFSTTQTNTITAGGQFTNDLGIAAAANATANITVRSPLQVSKAVNGASLASGEAGFFTITLSNDSSSPLGITSFTDDSIDGLAPGNSLPYGLKVTGRSNTCGSAMTTTTNNTGITVTGGTIPANGSCTITINYTGTVENTNAPSIFTNTMAAGAVGVSTPGIVSQPASRVVMVYQNINVSKVATPTNPAPGNPVRYQVTVQNFSASPISDLTFTDTFSQSQTFLTGTINGFNYTPSGCGVTNTSNAAVGATSVALGTISVPARTDVNTPGTCTVTLWSMTSTNAAANSAFSNTLPTGSVCYNAGAVCFNAATNSNGNINAASVLTPVKSFNPAGPLSEGTISRVTIRLDNLSANPITSATVADNLPTAAGGGQMRVAAVPNAATTCTGTPVITATAASTSVSMSGATVPARATNGAGAAGSCVLQFDVVGPAGTYSNTATASGVETYSNNTTHTTTPTVSNAAPLVYLSALGATKAFSPPAISSGGNSTVTIHLTNSGVTPLTSVSVTDPLPAGMVLSPTPNAYSTCAGPTSVSAAAGASSIGLTGAVLAGNTSCDLVFNVTATGSASWVNTIPVNNITADGGVFNQTPVAATLIFNSPTGLTVAKSTNPSTLTFPGQTSQLTITINNGSTPVSNLRLTDYFTTDGTAGASPNGMVIASTPAGITTCPAGIMTTTPGAASVSVAGATIAANTSCTLVVNVTSTSVGGITNFIPAGAIQTNQGLSNAGQASTSLTTQSNVGVTKKFTPNVVKPGERSRLRINFFNPTASPITSLNLTDNLPAGVTVPAGFNPVTTCVGANVTSPTAAQVQITGASVPATSGSTVATCYAEVDVIVAAQGDYTNTIPAGAISATSGGAPVTNAQPTSDILRAKAPVVIHKAIAGQTLDVGNPAPFTTGSANRAPSAFATMTIRITNPNAQALTAASLTDTLPTGLVVAGTPNASTTCSGGSVQASAAGTTVTLTGATLAANASCNVLVDVLSNISGEYINTIPGSALQTFEGVTNEEPTRAELIVSNPPTITKQFSPVSIAPNGVSTLTIFLNNDNAAAITLTSALVDTLPTAPGPIVVAPTPNIVKTCAGTVTAAAGSATVTYANGSSIPANGCTISVNVTGATAGAHVNTIPAGGLQTSVGNNPQPAAATLSISTLGFVSGRVFKDENVTPNGTYEAATDVPLSSIPIELRAGASCASPLFTQTGVTNPTITDASGNYSFVNLPAGTYSVCETSQPGGTVNGITTAGTISPSNGSTGTAGTASNPTATTSQITGIVLNGNGAGGEVSGSSNNNFAEVVPSSISGNVYLDQNNNGARNGADTPIAGVTIELLNSSNVLIATTTTAADGSYTFGNLLPGTYSVREPVQPAGTSNGVTSPGAVDHGGTPGTATTPATTPSRISNIVLPPDTIAAGNDFAEIPNGRSVSGRVILDYNNNGTLDASPDHGIGGQIITLTGTDINGNPVSMTTTSAADGTYAFNSVPEGTNYTLSEPSQPAGTTNGITSAGTTGGTPTNPTTTSSTITGINLSGTNTNSANNNFAEIPGAAPDLAIAKIHTPSTFTSPGSSGFFTITPRNIGTVATAGTVTVVDTLPAGMTVAAPATGTGWVCVGPIGATTVTCTTAAVIAAGGTAQPITLRVAVASGLNASVLTNTAVVSGGGEPSGFEGNNTATDSVVMSASASISGSVWRDLDHDRIKDAGETAVPNWTVELYSNGVMIGTTTTDANGAYAFANLAPGSGYEVRFREPGTGNPYGRPVPNETGATYTNGTTSAGNRGGATNERGYLQDITLAAGDNLVQQSLPLDPQGVVYDAVTRSPVQGAVVTISGPPGFDASQLLGGSLTHTTGTDGLYQFLLLPTAPIGQYNLTITAPAGYAPGASALLPACTNTLTVTSGPPDPALVQTSDGAPSAAAGNPASTPGACAATSGGLPAGAGTTQYYFSFNLDPSFPGGSANLVNNHIPLDPLSSAGFVISKTGNKRVVELGDTVLYTIVVRRTSGSPLPAVTVRDRLPSGFTYIKGTARANNVAIADPTGGVGPTLGFNVGSLALNASSTLTYRVRVGVGSMQGTGINTARAYGCVPATGCLDANQQPIPNAIQSNEAQYKVEVTGGVFTDEACVLGKIFVDCNGNHIQDKEELGIPGVRLYFQSGQYLVSDSEGKYSMCGLTPNSHVLKVDQHTLPKGSVLTTSSNRNLGDANSLFIDLKNGELHRADFIEGSCSNPVIEQVKARRAQGEVRSVETEKSKGPALRFESKPRGSPKQATDSANQPTVKTREGVSNAR